MAKKKVTRRTPRKKTAVKKTPAKDPFASLQAARRIIAPKRLKGAKQKLWLEFVARFADGNFEGVTMQALYEWGLEHLGLNCTRNCFLSHLREATKDQ